MSMIYDLVRADGKAVVSGEFTGLGSHENLGKWYKNRAGESYQVRAFKDINDWARRTL